MKRINKIYIGSLMALGLVSCSAEAPFKEDNNGGTGRFLTSSFDVEVKNQSPTTRVLSNGIPEAKDFRVEFYNSSDMNNPVKTFESYGSMPEIVELTAGDYVVKVSYFNGYGESSNNAAFNAPSYEGQSDSFKVEVDKIVDNIGTITGTLSNVRVKVQFGETLLAAMGSDSKVAVHVGESGTSLEFNKNTTDDGYFAYAEGSTTLAANFTGTVEGEKVNVTKNIADIKPGYYYIVTFNLQTTDAADPGNIVPDNDGDFTIDASVTVKDLTADESYNTDANPDPDQDQYLEDDMRPENGTPGNDDQPGTDDPNSGENNGDDNSGDNNGDDNQDPSEGDNSNQGGETPNTPSEAPGPQIVGNGSTKINEPNIDPESISFTVTSKTGFTGFKVQIKSEKLNAQVLEDVGLKETMDLVHPENEAIAANLVDLGFPVEGDVENQKSVTLSISDTFIFLLRALMGDEDFTSTHTFVMIPSDAEGTNSFNVIIELNK